MARIEVLGLGKTHNIPTQEQFRAHLNQLLGRSAKVDIKLNGHDIAEATVNFSGMNISGPLTEEVPNPFFTIDETDVVTQTTARIGRLRVIGEPVTLYGCEAQLLLTASDVRVNWLTLQDGSTVLALDTEGRFMPDLTIAGRAPRRELERALEKVLENPGKSSRMKMKQTEVHLEPHGLNGFHGWVTGTVKTGPVSLKVGVSAHITVTEHGIITFDRVAFRGRSILVRMLGKQVLQQIPKTVDLTESLPDGSRIEDLNVVVGKAVSLRGKVRQTRGHWWFPTPQKESSPPQA